MRPALARFYTLVGGNPYLVQRGLHELASFPFEIYLMLFGMGRRRPFGTDVR